MQHDTAVINETSARDGAHLLQQLHWRYATKKFDPSRKIPAEHWAVLEEAVSLAPSSYGLQPWRPFVVLDPEVRKRLRPVAHNQPQITDASHLVVFAAKLKITEQDVDEFIARIAQQRKLAKENLVAYRDNMLGDVVNGPRAKMAAEWSARQAYLGLGVLLSSAAQLGIDACPMEGFDPSAFNEILGLPAQGYSAVVLCTLGYRDPNDAYARLAKVRVPVREFVHHI